jgi:pantoate--beta-alanine ligase
MVQQARASGKKVGFVPTMGALHPGHASLIERASNDCDFVVVSVFVNPTQFDSAQDFATYPIALERDIDVAQAAGAHAVFTPQVVELYGGDLAVEPVNYGRLTSTFEGKMRKGHFDGVVAVVRKLFQAVQADAAYFGEKDLQQLAVIRRLAADEFEGLEIVGCPLIREEDGLAMSSRNVRMSDDDRQTALHLSGWLKSIRADVSAGIEVGKLLDKVRLEAAAVEGLELEYVDAVNGHTFEPQQVTGNGNGVFAIIAADVGGIRLIDNCRLACS